MLKGALVVIICCVSCWAFSIFDTGKGGLLEGMTSSESECVTTVSSELRNIDFEVISIKEEKRLAQRGFCCIEKDGEYILSICSGLRSSGGHSISVVKVEGSNKETVVTVVENSPGLGDLTTSALTYPTTSIRLSSDVASFFVVQTEDGEFLARL